MEVGLGTAKNKGISAWIKFQNRGYLIPCELIAYKQVLLILKSQTLMINGKNFVLCSESQLEVLTTEQMIKQENILEYYLILSWGSRGEALENRRKGKESKANVLVSTLQAKRHRKGVFWIEAKACVLFLCAIFRRLAECPLPTGE